MRLDWRIQIKKGNSGDLFLHSVRLCKGRWRTLNCQSTAQHWEKVRPYVLKSQDMVPFPLVNRIPIDFREFDPHHQSASLDQPRLGLRSFHWGSTKDFFLLQCYERGYGFRGVPQSSMWQQHILLLRAFLYRELRTSGSQLLIETAEGCDPLRAQLLTREMSAAQDGMW